MKGGNRFDWRKGKEEVYDKLKEDILDAEKKVNFYDKRVETIRDELNISSVACNNSEKALVAAKVALSAAESAVRLKENQDKVLIAKLSIKKDNLRSSQKQAKMREVKELTRYGQKLSKKASLLEVDETELKKLKMEVTLCSEKHSDMCMRCDELESSHLVAEENRKRALKKLDDLKTYADEITNKEKQEIGKDEAGAVLSKQHVLKEQHTKSQEAQKRKAKLEERAQARAVFKAKKDEEEKEKAKEKRAKRRERKKVAAAASTTASN